MTADAHLVELCCGTAAVSLWALGRLQPLTGYMGSKRRDAAGLCTLLGAREPAEVLLVDGGPWGDVWTTLTDERLRHETATALRRLDRLGPLTDVWPWLLCAPGEHPAVRAAQYLCLQARAAGCIPVWWSAERRRWESPSGSRTEGPHQRGGVDLRHRMCARGKKPHAGQAWSMDPLMPRGRKVGRLYRSASARGLVRIATLAERVESLDRIDWGRVTVVHGDVGEVAPIPGSSVYFDPPYCNAPRYACLLPRDRVLEIAAAWGSVARLVVVSEAEPLLLDGWTAQRLRPSGKPEWVTLSAEPECQPALQLELWEAAS